MDHTTPEDSFKPSIQRGFTYLFLITLLIFGSSIALVYLYSFLARTLVKHSINTQSFTKTITTSQLLTQSNADAIYQTESLTITKKITKNALTISILLTDSQNKPIPNSVGTVIYQGKTFAFPLSNAAGKAFLMIPQTKNPDTHLIITEQQEDFTISGTFS